MFVDKSFYREQFLWSKEHIDYDMEGLNTELVAELQGFVKKDAKTILELGGGNGQFAAAAALAGYDVTVIELVPECVAHIYLLKEKYDIPDERLTIIQGDFYKVSLEKTFDLVVYFDGFGIGSDEDQRRLLKRVASWMTDDGEAYIDIYTPWYWAKAAGERMSFDKIERIYNFDARGCRMTDTWWLTGKEENKITQSLRCYSPADLQLLLEGISLELTHVEAGGAMDYDAWIYKEKVPLKEAMMYRVTLQKE